MSRNCFDGNEKSFKFLNPFMDFRTLLIGLNSLKIRGFEMFKKNNQVFICIYIVHLSSTLSVHFRRRYYMRMGALEDSIGVKSSMITETYLPSKLEENGTKTMIWIGFNTKPAVILSNTFVQEAFPAIKYSYLQRSRQFEIKVGLVNEIYQPAMVVSKDMDPKSFFVQNYDLRKEVLHKHVDLLL